MTQIIVTKPGVLTTNDKRALRKAGVVPVEAENPEDVRLIQTEGPSLAADDLLHAAIASLNGDGYRSDARAAFTKILLVNMDRARADAAASNREAAVSKPDACAERERAEGNLPDAVLQAPAQ